MSAILKTLDKNKILNKRTVSTLLKIRDCKDLKTFDLLVDLVDSYTYHKNIKALSVGVLLGALVMKRMELQRGN